MSQTNHPKARLIKTLSVAAALVRRAAVESAVLNRAGAIAQLDARQQQTILEALQV